MGNSDMTGEPVNDRDIAAAIECVTRHLVEWERLALPPLLVVELPNILRCLQEMQAVRTLQRAVKIR